MKRDMRDVIYRQDVIDALWKALHEYEDKTEKQFQESDELDAGDWIVHRIFVQNMSDIDRQIILNLPSAQQWIPCSEKLPESNQCVLVSIKGEVDVDWIAVDSTGYGCWYRCMKDVISVDAWMPLPEPYRGGQDDSKRSN